MVRSRTVFNLLITNMIFGVQEHGSLARQTAVLSRFFGQELVGNRSAPPERGELQT
jgi:hypothetical protein